MIIYKVTNLKNQKVYIGQSRNSLEHRKSQHYREANSSGRNNYFHRALNKYNKSDFIWEVLEEYNSLEKLNAAEIKYIAEYNSTNRDIGYNRKLGGEQGLCCSSTKKLIGEHTKEVWKDPDKAARMRAGLLKGANTMKEKAKTYFEKRQCEICGKSFKAKPHYPKKCCSPKCVTKARGLANQRRANNKKIC